MRHSRELAGGQLSMPFTMRNPQTVRAESMFQTISIKTIVAVLSVLAVVAGIGYWIYWTSDAISTMTTQKTTIDEHVKTINGLRKDIEDFTVTKGKLDSGFSLIEDNQLDLICAARVQPETIYVPSAPSIVEVVKYRDAKTGCPTTDATKAEPYNPATTVLRPTNEEISLQTLNNAWKAYCLAINNGDEKCAPFR